MPLELAAEAIGRNVLLNRIQFHRTQEIEQGRCMVWYEYHNSISRIMTTYCQSNLAETWRTQSLIECNLAAWTRFSNPSPLSSYTDKVNFSKSRQIIANFDAKNVAISAIFSVAKERQLLCYFLKLDSTAVDIVTINLWEL